VIRNPVTTEGFWEGSWLSILTDGLWIPPYIDIEPEPEIPSYGLGPPEFPTPTTKDYFTKILPEYVIKEAIVDGFNEIRRNSGIVDVLFSSLPQHDLELCKDILNSNSIDVQVGYSQKITRLPAVAIVVGEESEFDGGKLLPRSLSDIESIIPGAVYDWPNCCGWARESLFDISYRLNILSNNSFMTIFLYNLVKYIVIKNVLEFEEEGILDIRLSGNDLSPESFPIPDLSYSRSLNMRLMAFANHIKVMDKITRFDVTMSVIIDDVTDDIKLISYPLEVTSVTPSTVSVNTNTDVIIEGSNIDKDVSVEFLDMEYMELLGGSAIGIRELDRNYTGDNSLRLTLRGYSTGTTRIKFTNPSCAYVTWDTFTVIN